MSVVIAPGRLEEVDQWCRVSDNPAPPSFDPLVVSDPCSPLSFDPHSTLPAAQIRAAMEEFSRTGTGERPRCVRWAHGEPGGGGQCVAVAGQAQCGEPRTGRRCRAPDGTRGGYPTSAGPVAGPARRRRQQPAGTVVDRACGIGVEDVGRVIAAGSDDRRVESTVGGADVQVLGGHLPVDDGGAAPLGEFEPGRSLDAQVRATARAFKLGVERQHRPAGRRRAW